MTPLVSVVIATRDRPEMVREAIDSVFAQTLDGDIEVIVVADQSEPDPSFVRSSDGRSTKVIANVRRPGLAGARNTGIEVASGEFVAFCDDDDLCCLPSSSARWRRFLDCPARDWQPAASRCATTATPSPGHWTSRR